MHSSFVPRVVSFPLTPATKIKNFLFLDVAPPRYRGLVCPTLTEYVAAALRDKTSIGLDRRKARGEFAGYGDNEGGAGAGSAGGPG